MTEQDFPLIPVPGGTDAMHYTDPRDAFDTSEYEAAQERPDDGEDDENWISHEQIASIYEREEARMRRARPRLHLAADDIVLLPHQHDVNPATPSKTYHELGLDRTVRVSENGKVTRGLRVPHRAVNLKGDNRVIAAPHRPGSGALRFAPGGIPRGVNVHLPCTVEGCAECRAIDYMARNGGAG